MCRKLFVSTRKSSIQEPKMKATIWENLNLLTVGILAIIQKVWDLPIDLKEGGFITFTIETMPGGQWKDFKTCYQGHNPDGVIRVTLPYNVIKIRLLDNVIEVESTISFHIFVIPNEERMLWTQIASCDIVILLWYSK